jgi:hypothetical protein
MPRNRLEWLAFLGCLAAVGALVVLDVRWRHRGDGAEPRAQTTAVPVVTIRSTVAGTSTVATPKRRATTRKKTETSPSRPAAAATGSVKPARLVLSATRGSCWLSVRLGSRTGPSLYKGVLQKGGTLRFSKARLWIRFGAAGNLDGALNGKKIEAFPQGTVEVYVTASSITPVG